MQRRLTRLRQLSGTLETCSRQRYLWSHCLLTQLRWPSWIGKGMQHLLSAANLPHFCSEAMHLGLNHQYLSQHFLASKHFASVPSFIHSSNFKQTPESTSIRTRGLEGVLYPSMGSCLPLIVKMEIIRQSCRSESNHMLRSLNLREVDCLNVTPAHSRAWRIEAIFLIVSVFP